MYLDEEVWAAVRQTRRRVAIAFVAVLLVLVIGVAIGFITFT
jgi:hypothetical protein